MDPSAAPRYDRIVSLVLVVVLGLAVIVLIDTNPNILRARLGGDLPTITVSWLLIATLVVITSAGADLLARSHPQLQTRTLPTLNLGFMKLELAPAFWILPSFSLIGSFAFFRLFSFSLEGLAFALSLVAAGGLLLGVLLAQHYALDRDPPRAQLARLALQIVAYLLAFSCFSAVYFTRFRTLYAATLIGLTGMLLAYAVLQWQPRHNGLLIEFLVGFLLGEATWALNYWSATFLLAGAILTVLFYCAVGLLQQLLSGGVTQRLWWEYGLIGGALVLAIVTATFL